MKRLLTAVLLIISTVFTSSISFAYNDISDHWARGYIENMEKAGVLGQFEYADLSPDQYMNRAECAELISDLLERFYNYTPDYSVNPMIPDLFPDSRNTKKINSLSDLYYFSAFTAQTNFDSNTIQKNKIINGFPDGNFRPFEYVTRAQFAKMIVSAMDCMGYIGIGDPPFHYDDLSVGEIYHWGAKYINIAYSLGIMNGYYQVIMPDGFPYIEFRPDGLITRAEAIKMVSQAMPSYFHGTKNTGTRYIWDSKLYHRESENLPDWTDVDEAITIAENAYGMKNWIGYNKTNFNILANSSYDNIITLIYYDTYKDDYYYFIMKRNYNETNVIFFEGFNSFPNYPVSNDYIDNITHKIIGVG
ncbi:MAG: S-layer homology domain-containing protein [Andreesenia angusta]|nr:S-layer homology domain-containing protein [Andreesenia angusta]